MPDCPSEAEQREEEEEEKLWKDRYLICISNTRKVTLSKDSSGGGGEETCGEALACSTAGRMSAPGRRGGVATTITTTA